MNILVTGRNGQLSSEIEALEGNYSAFHFTFIGKEDLDLTDKEAVSLFFQDKTFDLLINCAAYTAVDQAEDDALNAAAINTLAVKYLVEEAEKKKIRIIHVSTDYVFNGENHVPYLETDGVSPLGVYGRSKLEGEEFVIESKTPSMVIRTSWLYSRFGNNFVKTMIRLGEEREVLGVIADQVGTPTNAADLAKLCLQICTKTDLWSTTNEVYHYSNDGVCSWYDFAETIMELSGTACTIKPIETTEYPTRVTRPHYSVLNKRKIKNQFDFPTIYWRDSLKSMLKSLK